MTTSRRAAVLVAALAGMAVLLMAAAGVLWSQVWQEQRDATRDQAVLGVARHTVIDLLTVDQADPHASLDRLLPGSTGEFKQQLVSESDVFTQALTGAKVTSAVSINELGIRTVADDRASVLVSAVSEVRNEQVPGGHAMPHRILVELRNEGQAWLVSKLEFLP